MATFLLILSLFLAIFSGLLCWQVVEQKKIITNMMAAIVENDPLPGMEKEPELILTLKVLNPILVAKRESRSARLLADKLPVMIRKMVYQGVMKELEEEMIQRDIDVEMNIEYR